MEKSNGALTSMKRMTFSFWFPRKSTVFAWFLILPSLVLAQRVESISGTVRNASSLEPLPYANIVIKDTYLGTTSNVDGYFFLGSINQDSFTVICSYIGFKPYRQTVVYNGDSHVVLAIALEPRSLKLEEVVVQDSQLVRPSVEPAYWGGDSLLVPTPISPMELNVDWAPTYPVHLAPPLKWLPLASDYVAYEIDGVPVPSPHHQYSVYPPYNLEAVKLVTHHPWGVEQKPGMDEQQVVEMIYNDGNRSQLVGKGRIGLLESSLTLSGPHVLGGSWYFSGRRADFDGIYSLNPKRIAGGLYRQAPDYYFYDLNGKFTWDISPLTVLSSSFLLTYDKLSWLAKDDYHAISDWRSSFFITNLQHRFSPQWSSWLRFFTTRYHADLYNTRIPFAYGIPFNYDLTNDWRIWGLSFENDYYLHTNNRVTGALFLQYRKPIFDRVNGSNLTTGNHWLSAMQASYTRTITPYWRAKGAVDLQYNSATSEFNFNPRLLVFWTPSNIYGGQFNIGRFSLQSFSFSLPTAAAQPLYDFFVPVDNSSGTPIVWSSSVKGFWIPAVGYRLQAALETAFASDAAIFDSTWTGSTRRISSFAITGLERSMIRFTAELEKRIGKVTGRIQYQLSYDQVHHGAVTWPAPAYRPQVLLGDLKGQAKGLFTGYRVTALAAAGKRYLDRDQKIRVAPAYFRVDATLFRQFHYQGLQGSVALRFYNLLHSESTSYPVDAWVMTSLTDRSFSLLPAFVSVSFNFQF